MDILLLPPKLNNQTLEYAIRNRRTKRNFSKKELPLQELSNIPYVACGITQEETKRSKSRRTTPSSRNSQNILLYVLLQSGIYLYNELEHILEFQKEGNYLGHIGTQKMMKEAPFGVVFVSDFNKLPNYVGKDDSKKWFVAGTEAGCMSQNVYLYCANHNLHTALLGLVNRDNLHSIMGLSNNQHIIYTQVIGYPK